MSTGTGPRRLGKYELQERQGRGGMAEVWKALDTQLQRYVAIKVLHADLQSDPTFTTRFLREARVLASLHHPNIVQIHDFQISNPPESDHTMAYMVMDYIEGPTLSNYIRRTSGVGQFPSANEIVNLFASISGAVDYAHKNGMIHRDIKPANILLDQHYTSLNPMGEPMLTDFGIAKLLGTTTNSMSGSWLGTLMYASPEQIKGYPGNERSDIYSLGIILYEMCTGVLPFHGTDPAEIMAQHVNQAPSLPERINPNIPPALSMVIMRSLAKDPRARFPSAASMTAALAEAFHVPIPEGLRVPGYPVEAMNGPTYISQSPSVASPPMSIPTSMPVQSTPTPASSAGYPVQSATASTPTTGYAALTPQPASTPVPAPISMTPTHRPPDAVDDTPTIRSTRSISLPPSVPPISVPLPVPPVLAPPHVSTRRTTRRRPLFVALIVTLLVVFAGAGLGGVFLLTHQPSAAALAGPPGGVAFFVSSGQTTDEDNQGTEDQIQVTLHSIPNLAPGKSYYAWLLTDIFQSQVPCHATPLPIHSLFLGKLPVSSGNASLLYPGVHTNLFASYSRFVVTEDNAQGTPAAPSSDRHSWRYYAEFVQTPAKVGRCFTALDFTRHLLSEGIQISLLGLHTGINEELFKNTQKIQEWASSARDAWGNNPAFLHRQVVRILDLLDSSKYVQLDAPHEPLLVDARFAPIPMIDVVKNQGNNSYLRRIENQLNGISRSPGTTPETRKVVRQDTQVLNNLQAWLGQERKDAQQLVVMHNDRLSQPATVSILDDLYTQANYALVGQRDPSTGVVQSGAVQIYYTLQQLATFHVQPYKAS